MKKSLLFLTAFFLSACSAHYSDQILPPTEQLREQDSLLHPQKVMREGIFHMQRVQEGSDVRIQETIVLKRPDLPPFDVAYISRNAESVLLELANASGESIVIPNGLRSRTVTLVHSGANFREMLDIVLTKVGYHYDYRDGIWYITRFPTRNYTLEVSQSDRRGSLLSAKEVTPEDDSTGDAVAGMTLDTDYTDKLWDQVENTLKELINIGNIEPTKGTAAAGINAMGRMLSKDDVKFTTADGASEDMTEELFGSITASGGLSPRAISQIQSTDHLQPEEKVDPWYKITRSAGMITVRAAPQAHQLIEEYLAKIQENSFKQVYVEVRIVAVIRDRTTDRGTNLSKSTDFGDTVLGSIGFSASSPVTSASAKGGILNIFSQKSNGAQDMSFILQDLSKIANVYTISSPALIARNNQLSRVSLTKQLGYAETEVDQNTTSTGDIIIGSRTDKAKFKNAGTVLSVFPFIGKSRVQLRLRLAVASKSGDTAIQTTVGTEETITNLVPELTNNVIDQDMVLEYGRLYAIGKLVETSITNDKNYVPGLINIPGMADIFQRATDRKLDTEFIVLLRVSRS